MSHTGIDFKKEVDNILSEVKRMGTVLSWEERVFMMLYEINENIKTNNLALSDILNAVREK